MTTFAVNKRARFDYEFLEEFEAGIELRGFEAKAVKSGRLQIAGAYAVPRGEEFWLLNADIPPYQPKNTPPDYDPKRSRRLLLNKKEIDYLLGKLKEKNLTIVPFEVYTKNRFLKIKLALARPKKKADKRETLKRREVEREIRNFRG